MPNRPRKKKLTSTRTKVSNRKIAAVKGTGAILADGTYQSKHDLRCLQIQGCKLEKAFGLEE